MHHPPTSASLLKPLCQQSAYQTSVWWQAVDEVLEVMGQDGAQQVPCPSWHYQDQGSQAQPSGNDSTRQLPLAEALTKCYDLRSANTCTAYYSFNTYEGFHFCFPTGFACIAGASRFYMLQGSCYASAALRVYTNTAHTAACTNTLPTQLRGTVRILILTMCTTAAFQSACWFLPVLCTLDESADPTKAVSQSACLLLGTACKGDRGGSEDISSSSRLPAS